MTLKQRHTPRSEFPSAMLRPRVERRRLARCDSGPGRRFAEPISQFESRNQPQTTTKTSIRDLALRLCRSATKRNMWVNFDRKTATIHVNFAATVQFDADALRWDLDQYVPCWALIEIRRWGVNE